MRISDWSSNVCSADLEALVAEEAPAAAIVRLPLIISLDPEDHIVGAIRAGVRNRERSVWFHDELRQPALASELAEAVWRITALDEGDRSGPWHLPGPESLKIGRAHVCTPVTNAHIVCRLLLE